MEFRYIDYMRNLASSHKLLKHSEGNRRFYVISSINNLEELLSNSKATFPLLCVNNDDSGRFQDTEADMVFDRKPFSFYIFANYKNVLDMNEMDVQKDICRQIGFDFISKMKADKKHDMKGFFPKTGLRSLDVSSITYFQIGPLLDNIVGYEFFFSMDDKPDLKFNSSAWDDIMPTPRKLKIGWFHNTLITQPTEDDLLSGTTVNSFSPETVFKINCQADHYIYFFLPTEFIPSNDISFWIGGFEGGFIKLPGTLLFNNSDAGMVEYTVYRSDNQGLGYCIVNVKAN